MPRLLALLTLLVAAPAWGQPVFLQQLSDPSPGPGSQFGSAVALDGDFIAVGEPGEAGAVGRAFVFFREPGTGTWALQEELIPSSLEEGGEFDPAFGSAVAFDGPNALVGAPYESGEEINSGAAYIFRKDEETGTWMDFAKLKAPTPALEDQFGAAVAISGATAAVGAFDDDEDGTNTGAVYLFTQDVESGSWTFSQRVTPEDAAPGIRFGSSVALSGDLLVVGLLSEISAKGPGAVYVFERTGEEPTPWQQVQRLVPDDAEAGDLFGFDVAVDGSTILAGAPLAGPSEEGSAYVYERTGADPAPWVQTQRLIAETPQDNAQFGTAVSLDGDLAVVGAPLDGTEGSTGAVYTFERTSGVWTPNGFFRADTPEEGALFGRAVALSSEITVVGSPDADVAAEDAGAVYIYSLLPTAAEGETAPGAFGLGAPYPNPAHSDATLTYTLPATGDVTLAAFDVLGREVAVLEAGQQPAGSATVRWNTSALPAGVYFVRLVSDGRTATRKILIIR